MNYCLILIQSSELELCTSSTILIMPCNELMSWTLWNVGTMWLQDMLNLWCILTIFDVYCLRQVIVKPTQTWTTESAKKLSQFLELLLSAKWTTAKLYLGVYWHDCSTSRAKPPGATHVSVAPGRMARLVQQSRQCTPRYSFALSQMSNKSRAMCFGATMYWVAPRRLARLVKLSRQAKPQFSTALVQTPDKGVW
jgi:hypothetical protein